MDAGINVLFMALEGKGRLIGEPYRMLISFQHKSFHYMV